MGAAPNEGQRAVIETLEGGLFVSAGAGSGKTFALAHRFARALTHGPAAMDELLTITFTEKAAGELVERVRRTLTEAGRVDLARRVDEAWISTIHGLCSRLLRRHALEAGVDTRFEVLDAVATGVLMHQAFEEAVEVCRSDEGAETLIDDYGLGVVRDCVLEAHGRLRAMGRDAGELLPWPKARFDAAVHSAAQRLASLEVGLSELKETPSIAENRVRIGDARSLLLEPDPEAVFRGLKGLKLAKRGSEEAKQLAREGDEIIAAVVGNAAEHLVQQHETSFLALLGAFAESYERLKAKRGSLDFDDLQLRAARLLEERPDVAARYRERFRIVMVDEFQDTDELQTRVIEPLVDEDLCTVGDDKQSIYSFRYAEVEVFRALQKQMRATGAARAELDVNYRSHPDILAFVNAVFGRPPFFEDLMRLKAGRKDEDPAQAGLCRVELLVTPSACDDGRTTRDIEALVVAERVARLIDEGVAAGDIVLLLRAKGPIGAYAAALRSLDVPVSVAAEAGFFARPEVALGLALVRSLANPNDDEALARLLSGPVGRVRDDALYLLRKHRQPSSSLWDALASAAHLLDSDDADACRRTVASIRAARDVLGREGLRAGLEELLRRLDVDLALLLGDDGERAWANVRKIVRLADDFERTASADPAAFVDYLGQRESHVRSEPPPATVGEGAAAVRIMTQHAAKGLEFPVVVVPDLGRELPVSSPAFLVSKTPEGPRLSVRFAAGDEEAVRTPSYEQAYSEARRREVEEEKRLLYVACTRAEDRLILSGASDPAKPADDRPMGWLREALGMGVEGALAAGDVDLGDGARVEVVLAEEPQDVERPECEPEREPQRLRVPDEPGVDQDAASIFIPPTVSYSGIAEYRRCPRRYYLSRHLRLASPEIAPKPEDPLAFGSAVHAALQVEALGLLDEGRLEALARGHGLDVPGRERLRQAVDAWRGSTTSRRLAALGSQRPRSPEVPFAVPVGRTLLVGTLDLLAWGGGSALIVDYKTGVPDRDEDLRHRYQTQAECYALAALRSGAERVEVEFVLLERGGEAVTFGFERSDSQRLAAGVEGVLAEMEKGSFPALEEFDRQTCRGCPGLDAGCAVSAPASVGRR